MPPSVIPAEAGIQQQTARSAPKMHPKRPLLTTKQ